MSSGWWRGCGPDARRDALPFGTRFLLPSREKVPRRSRGGARRYGPEPSTSSGPIVERSAKPLIRLRRAILILSQDRLVSRQGRRVNPHRTPHGKLLSLVQGAARRHDHRLDGGDALPAAPDGLPRRRGPQHAAVRNLQGDGAAALPRHPHARHAGRLGHGPLDRLPGRVVPRALAARQDPARGADDGRARRARRQPPPFPQRRQHQVGDLLPRRQRDPHRAVDRRRDPGGRESRSEAHPRLTSVPHPAASRTGLAVSLCPWFFR